MQAYAIYDGPGIRTCVYFKGCPLHCNWCHNPESQKPGPEMAYWKEKCKACGACVDVCPKNALRLIQMAVGAGLKPAPTAHIEKEILRDHHLCVACGACARACPNDAMERIGYEISVDDIVGTALRDKVFFDNSGGGVTISGGEPTFQESFLMELLKSLKAAGVHTSIETCGHFSEDMLIALLNEVDLFLFDIKHLNPDKHKECTGASNEIILNNFSEILRRTGAERIIPRIPLIPGFNTDEKSVNELISFLKQSDYNGPVHLLPYHSWAKGKYDRIGRAGSFRAPGKISETELEKISGVFNDAGFPAVCYG